MDHGEVRSRLLRRRCQDIIQEVMKLENAHFFFRPVDPQVDGAPDYFLRVTDPMSVFEVQENLDNKRYTCFESFVTDMRKIWQNAQCFNNANSILYKAAEKISRHFELIISAIPHEISLYSRCSALQRAVELRFAGYREQRKSHQ